MEKRLNLNEYLGPNDEDKQLAIDDPLVSEKIAFIVDALGCLISKGSIIKGFLDKYGGAKSTAYNYYNMAVQEIQGELKKTREEHISESINSMKAIAKRALSKGDHAAAVSALKYKDTVVTLTKSFNEMGTPTDGFESGETEKIDSQSARDLASLIAGTEATTGKTQSPAVEPSPRPND